MFQQRWTWPRSASISLCDSFEPPVVRSPPSAACWVERLAPPPAAFSLLSSAATSSASNSFSSDFGLAASFFAGFSASLRSGALAVWAFGGCGRPAASGALRARRHLLSASARRRRRRSSRRPGPAARARPPASAAARASPRSRAGGGRASARARGRLGLRLGRLRRGLGRGRRRGGGLDRARLRRPASAGVSGSTVLSPTLGSASAARCPGAWSAPAPASRRAAPSCRPAGSG